MGEGWVIDELGCQNSYVSHHSEFAKRLITLVDSKDDTVTVIAIGLNRSALVTDGDLTSLYRALMSSVYTSDRHQRRSHWSSPALIPRGNGRLLYFEYFEVL